MKKQLVLISIIVIMGLIIVFWVHNLKFTLSSTPSLKEEKLFSLLKEGFKMTKNVIKVPTSTIENFSSAETPTDQEILTKEQIETLKEKIRTLRSAQEP